MNKIIYTVNVYNSICSILWKETIFDRIKKENVPEIYMQLPRFFELVIQYFIFQKYCFYAIYMIVVLFYKFDYIQQYLRERFNTTSGFHFETRSSISGSHVFYLHWKK